MSTRNILLQFFFVLFLVDCSANTILVGPGQLYTSIQQAMAMASDGDSLIVHAGLYREGNIKIQKRLTLIGINWPVLDGEHKFEVISILSDAVEVTGFVVRHSPMGALEDPSGIKVNGSKYVVIRNNRLEDNYFGIYVSKSSHCIIRDNHISAHGVGENLIGNGIHCWRSDSLQIIGNRISGHRDGIYFEFVTGSLIWRNISKQNTRYGLHFMFSHNDAYITNVFEGNGAGVAVMFTRHVKMFNNTFRDNWGDAAYGLLLKEISDSYLFNNRFSNNTTAILMEGVSRCTIEKNEFKDNGWALKIQASCMDNEMVLNNFISNTFDVGTNGHLVMNVFRQNYWDKYEGYDLDHNGIGDVPFRPLSIFSIIVEKNPPAMLMYKSMMITLLDRSEKMIPTLTPDLFRDDEPLMKSLPL